MYFEALLLDTYDYLVSFRRNWLFFFCHKMTFINSVVGYEIVTEMISVVPHRNPIILFMCKLSFFFFFHLLVVCKTCIFILSVLLGICKYTACVSDADGFQKMAPDPLELS